MRIRRERMRATAMVIAGLALALAACGNRPDAAPRLQEGAVSLEALGDSVWTALVQRDTARLGRMKITEAEHNELMWPEMPASAPEADFPVAFAWQNIQLRNRAALADLLAAYGGSEHRLLATRCPGPVQRYESFRALTGCVLELAAGADTVRVQAFRYLVVMDGRYKVVRYYGSE